MTRVIPLLIALSLTACASKSTPPVDFPDLPPLPASVTAACPPAGLLSGSSLANLVHGDIDLAVDYAECVNKHAAAVAAYETARAKIAEAKAKVGR